MSSNLRREIEIIDSSLSQNSTKLSGAFFITLIPNLMMNIFVEFLWETFANGLTSQDTDIQGFLEGSRYRNPQIKNELIWCKNFNNIEELKSFDIDQIFSSLTKLSLYLDSNLTWIEIIYKVDNGSGFNTPIRWYRRTPLTRGISFELEERAQASTLLSSIPITLTEKQTVASNYYNTGMSLLGLEDQLPGFIDAAFMQFYLGIETFTEYSGFTLNKIKRKLDSQNIKYTDDDITIIEHIYSVRNNYYAHPSTRTKSSNIAKAMKDDNFAFQIAKQVLIARFILKRLISLSTNTTLPIREMFLYFRGVSYSFNGDTKLLLNDFRLS